MNKKRIPIVSTLGRRALLLMALVTALVLILACAPQPPAPSPTAPADAAADVQPTSTERPAATVAPTATAEPPATMEPTMTDQPAATVEPTMTEQPAATVAPTASAEPEDDAVIVYTLVTVAEGGLFYRGQGGDIDGIINPTLEVAVGGVVEIILINGDGNRHDIVAPDLGIESSMVRDLGSETSVIWEATQAGEFFYWCSVSGHRAAGMECLIVITD